MFEFTAELILPRPRNEVFPFFADAGNLELLTPPWLHFQILTPRPIEMRVGTRIEYRLRLHGIPLAWESEITEWDPPYAFTDEQLRGPYRTWIHRHTFEEIGDRRTLCRDRVRYRVFGGSLVNRFLVRPDIEKIFRYRSEKLLEIFASGKVGANRD